MKKSALFLVISSVLIVPAVAFAQVTVTSLVVSAAHTAWIIATGVVVILWIVTGILFLTAQGAPEKINTAKKALLTSVAGTVVVIMAYSALRIIAGVFGA